MDDNTPHTFAGRLKQATAQDHLQTEDHPFQMRLGGAVSLRAYRIYLAQLARLHDAIDAQLKQLGPDAERLADLLPFHRHRVSCLREDLAELLRRDHSAADDEHLEWKPPVDVGWVSECNAIALAGALYVIEGSANGGHYAAKSLRESLSLDGTGTRFLDPHGDEQHSRWREYKQLLNRLDVDPQEADAAIAAARKCFRAFEDASDIADQADG